MSCRHCGSGQLDRLGICAFGDRESTLLRCRQCDLTQRQPIPDETALAAMYADTSPDAMNYAIAEHPAWSTARSLLGGRAGAALRVLDIGCHTGAFLAALPDEWQRFGIESATGACAVARARQVEIIAPRLQSVDADWCGQFDAVTAFDVLEHLPDPALALRSAARLLKPGGVMIVSTGDIDRWTFRALRGAHWYWQTEQHISAVSRRFLVFAGRESGLVLSQFRTIAHRRAPLALRLYEAMQVCYWYCRLRGGVWRAPQRLLQALPTLRHLRHAQLPAWTMTLKDHCLAVFEPASR